MSLWTTYLSFITRNEFEIAEKLRALKNSHGMIVYYVARKRGNDVVAPSQKLLADAKAAKIGWQEYKENYLADLRSSEDAYEWMKKVAKETKNLDVILVCFEKDATHCHRTLLAEEIAITFPDIQIKGEVTQLFREAPAD